MLNREWGTSVSVCPRDKLDVYGEETSLRHVAMVAKFLDDNKPKLETSLKMWIRNVSNFIEPT